ncbi:S-adenosyl-L-methionine-dependent methyltransferase [Podospora appendiculata]|uniref:S-adenosyl-L-methionine-dependent methyltransferase n=1 Tax=Podospora appendiculata TaxID=314037 RepID=A0AAE1CBL8_9PEZI|nr:S-adenosyl-L-methionine-dependent methyltransferase [Podospora appendiculata]KAK3687585.1 S-adenosyl-L-methionine-dependent methyltransferase [Podospora appendiculata]
MSSTPEAGEPSAPRRSSHDAPVSGNERAVREEAAASTVTPATAEEEGPTDVIEAEDGPVEEDEFLAEGWDSSSSKASTSVTSSVYHHAYENGRRYHAYRYGRYPIPNDDLEQNREDMRHASMLETTDGKLFYAPIGDHPGKIIDIGTGTGIWAIEMGDLFPSAEILGLDLSPIQPTWVPPNVKFIVDDIEDEWASGSGWDYAHFRNMAVILRDLQKVVDQTFHHLKPGGWIEFQETWGMPFCEDGTMPEDDIMKRYFALCAAAMAKFGMNVDLGPKVGEHLERAGFINVGCVKKKMPMGTWPKDKRLRLIGLYVRELALHSLASLGKVFANLGMSPTEIEVWGATVRAALKESDKVHRYYFHYFWYAQKPEEAS